MSSTKVRYKTPENHNAFSNRELSDNLDKKMDSLRVLYGDLITKNWLYFSNGPFIAEQIFSVLDVGLEQKKEYVSVMEDHVYGVLNMDPMNIQLHTLELYQWLHFSYVQKINFFVEKGLWKVFPCTQKTKNKHFNELSLDEVFYASEQFDEALKRKHAAKKEVLKDDYSKRFYDNILEQYKGESGIMSLVLASLRNHTPLKDTSNLGDARENQATKSFLLKTNTQVSVDRPVALPFGIVNTRSLYNIPNSISDQNLLANGVPENYLPDFSFYLLGSDKEKNPLKDHSLLITIQINNKAFLEFCENSRYDVTDGYTIRHRWMFLVWSPEGEEYMENAGYTATQGEDLCKMADELEKYIHFMKSQREIAQQTGKPILDSLMDSVASIPNLVCKEGTNISGDPTKKSTGVHKAPIKGLPRMVEKFLLKANGDINALTDIARGTLEFETFPDLIKGLEVFIKNCSKHSRIKSLHIIDKFGKIFEPASIPSGYRDIKVMIVTEDGGCYEVQFNLKKILQGKCEGIPKAKEYFDNMNFSEQEKEYIEIIKQNEGKVGNQKYSADFLYHISRSVPDVFNGSIDNSKIFKAKLSILERKIHEYSYKSVLDGLVMKDNKKAAA